jgi:hypothetical protein
MKRIAADVLIGPLADWGADTVFTLPGDGINGIRQGLRRHADLDHQPMLAKVAITTTLVRDRSQQFGRG